MDLLPLTLHIYIESHLQVERIVKSSLVIDDGS